MQKKKTFAFKLVLVSISIVVAAGVTEVFLKFLLGKKMETREFRRETAFQEHEIRGWSNRPGVHERDFGTPEKPVIITYNVGNHGERLAGPNTAFNEAPHVLFLGDSFSFGAALNEESIFPGKVAKRLAPKTVVNLGVPAYSTYQALLTLRQVYAQKSKPKNVVLGFVGYQVQKNIASHQWRKMLHEYRNAQINKIPSVKLASFNQLSELSPVPLAEVSELFCFSKLLCAGFNAYNRWSDRRNEPMSVEATKVILKSMNQLVQTQCGKFTVLLLDEGSQTFKSTLDSEGILNYSIPFEKYPILSWDYHPTEEFHTVVANAVLSIPGL